jgi:hypothetical protein
MSDQYTPTTWVNGTTPAINATRMNNIEDGISLAHDRADSSEEAIAVIESNVASLAGLPGTVGTLEERTTTLEDNETGIIQDIVNLQSDVEHLNDLPAELAAVADRTTSLETRATNLEGRATSLETTRYIKSTSNVNYHINPSTGNDANNGTSFGTPFKTFAKVRAVLGNEVNHTVGVLLQAGTYTEAFDFSNLLGTGYITFVSWPYNRSGIILQNGLYFNNVKVNLTVDGLTLSNSPCIITNSQNVDLQHIDFISSTLGTDTGVIFADNAIGTVRSSYFENKQTCVKSQSNSVVNCSINTSDLLPTTAYTTTTFGKIMYTGSTPAGTMTSNLGGTAPLSY